MDQNSYARDESEQSGRSQSPIMRTASPEDNVSLLHKETTDVRDMESRRRPSRWYSSIVWPFVSAVLLVVLLIQTAFNIRKESGYDNGFATEIAELRPAIKTHQVRYGNAIRAHENGTLYPVREPGATQFSGLPSKEIDAAWDELLFGRYVSLNEDETRWLNSDRGIPGLSKVQVSVPGTIEPGFYGGPDMLHSLHCLNALRKHMDMDYYKSQPMPIPKQYQRMHIDHCFDQLRQAVLCHGDMTPVTLKPVRTEKMLILLGETERMHTCRDGEQLIRAWREKGDRRGRFASD